METKPESEQPEPRQFVVLVGRYQCTFDEVQAFGPFSTRKDAHKFAKENREEDDQYNVLEL